MGIGDVLRGLFGGTGGEAAAPETGGPEVDYKGYRVQAAPRRNGGQWSVAGVIAKDFPDGTKEHAFIRADSFADRDAAAELALIKGKRLVDEQGDHLFEG